MENKDIKVILSNEADKVYTELNELVGKEKNKGIQNSFHQTLLRSIKRANELLKKKSFCGGPNPEKINP